jgi:hypothetical protein
MHQSQDYSFLVVHFEIDVAKVSVSRGHPTQWVSIYSPDVLYCPLTTCAFLPGDLAICFEEFTGDGWVEKGCADDLGGTFLYGLGPLCPFKSVAV